MPRGTRPTHRVCITRKDPERKTRTYAGVAWENENGCISIVLNPGIIVDWRDDVWINLYEIDKAPPQSIPEDEDPIPF
jgi:hypothetical protein